MALVFGCWIGADRGWLGTTSSRCVAGGISSCVWAEAAKSLRRRPPLARFCTLFFAWLLACAYSVPSPGPSGLGARFSLRFPPPPAPAPPLPPRPPLLLPSAPALPLGRSSAACSPATSAPGVPNSSSLLGALKLTPSLRPPPCAPQRPRLTRSAQRPRLTVASASARRHRAWPPPEPGFDAVSGFSVCAWPPLLDLTAVPAPGHRTRTRLRCPRPDSGSAPCRRTRPWPIGIDSGSVWGAPRTDPAVGIPRPAAESPWETASPGECLASRTYLQSLHDHRHRCPPAHRHHARRSCPRSGRRAGPRHRACLPAWPPVRASAVALWPLPLFVSLPS